MNHPFPANIPLLRRLYEGRFSSVLFLVPFERMPDEDVVTVYRGSYTHAAYLTDARERLLGTECDYFVVVHDDVLLNPRISDETFFDFFPLEPGDGFIPAVFPPGAEIGSWAWHYGLVPKLLYPKSLLFGSGVEAATLRKYLPSPEAMAAKLEASSLPYRSQVILTQEAFDDVAAKPSLVLLHGLSARIPPTPGAAAVSEASLDVERRLVDTLRLAAEVDHRDRGGPPAHGDLVNLPVPLTASGFYTDFYIVPRVHMAEYVHYVGISAAANLFVEVMAPTFLAACCDRLWTAAELGFDISGFTEGVHPLRALADPKLLAIHPVKLSELRDDDALEIFFAQMRSIREGLGWSPPIARPGEFNLGSAGVDVGLIDRGWHYQEEWGRWAAASPATLQFRYDWNIRIRGVKLKLIAPLPPNNAKFTGSVRVTPGSKVVLVSARSPRSAVEVTIPASALVPGEINQIEVVSDRLVRPTDLHPDFGDLRPLGFGISSIIFY